MTDQAQDYIDKIEDVAQRVAVRQVLVSLRVEESGWSLRAALEELSRGVARDLAREFVRRALGRVVEDMKREGSK